MRDVVVIERWPSKFNYHAVFFHGKQVGAVDGDVGEFWNCLPNTYDKLLDCDKELIAEHVDEFICVLKITNRLTE